MALGTALARRIRPPALTAAAGPSAYPGATAVAQSRVAVGIYNRRGQAWQEDAWAFFDTIGAAKYAARYVGNAFARLRLVAGVMDENGENPTPVSTILDAIENPDDSDGENGNTSGIPEPLLRQAQVELSRIRSCVDGQEGILRDWGQHLTVAGDCNLVGVPATPNSPWPDETWDVYSITQVVEMDPWEDGTRKWGLRAEGASIDVVLPYKTVVRRIYQPHPKRKELADSPFRGILDDLEELALLKRAVRSIARSRVGTAGVFLVPDELDFAVRSALGDADPNAVDGLVADLVKHMTTPLENEGSAANVVPHILRGPAEHLKEVRHVPFLRPLEEVFIKLRDEKLRDIAVGLDLPPEVLTGIGDTNHWGAWQVAEETYKAHIEPPAKLSAAQLAAGVWRPMLTAAPDPNLPATMQLPAWPKELVDRLVILVDASALIDRPDQSGDALNLHKEYALSDEALRRYSGFTDEDAPSPEEVADRVERERLIHTRGSVPEQLPPGDVSPDAPNEPAPPPMPDTPPPADPPAQNAVTAAARPSRPIGQRLTALDQALQARIAGMAEQAVRRALERAGARITSKAAKNSAVAQAARGVPKGKVAATLGKAVVASLDVDDSDLLDEDMDGFCDDATQDVEDTRRRALAILTGWLRPHGRTVSEAALIELEAQIVRDSTRGREVLLNSLKRYAKGRLYELDAQPDMRGEGVAAGRIPPGVIRIALAAYGGQDVIERDDGTYTVDLSDQSAAPTVGGLGPMRGVAGGTTLLDFGAGQGAVIEGWTWRHDGPTVPFPPHEDLDGQFFAGDSSEDDRLDNGGAWTGYSTWQIGDHQGCLCSAEDTWAYADDVSGDAGD